MTVSLVSPGSGITTIKGTALLKINTTQSDMEADEVLVSIDGHSAQSIMQRGRGHPISDSLDNPLNVVGAGLWCGQAIRVSPSDFVCLIDTRDYKDESHKITFKLFKDGRQFNRLEATVTFNQSTGTAPAVGTDGFGTWAG